MFRQQAFIAALVGCWAAGTALPATAQGAPARAVDVRSIAPAPSTSAEVDASASSMTREQRKQQTIKARADGALKPAGEAAEFRDDAAGRAARREPAPVPSAMPSAALASASEKSAQSGSGAGVKSTASPHRPKRKNVARDPGVRHPASPLG